MRLVYAPAEGIGDFGGETDNWRWPRHTGDWSYLRAYVGKDGKPAPFSKDNVPYKPKHWLKVSPAGVKEGDLVFVVGYPGRTQRHQTYAEVKETTEWAFPRSVAWPQEQIAILETLGEDGPRARRSRWPGACADSTTGSPTRRAMLEGLREGRHPRAEGSEREGPRRLDRGRPRPAEAKYGDVLPALAALQAEAEKTREAGRRVPVPLSCASSYLTPAQSAHRSRLERPKSRHGARVRLPGTRLDRIREGQERAQRIARRHGSTGRCSRWAMARAAALPADQRIAPLDELAGLTPGMTKADADRRRSTPTSTAFTRARRWATATSAWACSRRRRPRSRPPRTRSWTSPWRLDPLLEQNREAGKNRQGAYARLRPRYMEALLGAGRRPRRARRQQHAARDLRQVKGVEPRRTAWSTSPSPRCAGIVAEAHRGGRVRRARAPARGHPGPARRARRRPFARPAIATTCR